jgi:hypothetical protein
MSGRSWRSQHTSTNFLILPFVCSVAAACVTIFVTFDRQFDYGHMDFTFSAKEELGYYISSLLSRK